MILMKADIKIYCKLNNKPNIKQIKLERYSGKIIKSGFKFKLYELYTIKNNQN